MPIRSLPPIAFCVSDAEPDRAVVVVDVDVDVDVVDADHAAAPSTGMVRQYRGLRAPPRGYRYVQSGSDAVLVGIGSGIIAAIIAGAIR